MYRARTLTTTCRTKHPIALVMGNKERAIHPIGSGFQNPDYGISLDIVSSTESDRNFRLLILA